MKGLPVRRSATLISDTFSSSPHAKCKGHIKFYYHLNSQSFDGCGVCVFFVLFCFIVTTGPVFVSSGRDLQKNEISWTIEDMNGPFSALDKLKKL